MKTKANNMSQKNKITTAEYMKNWQKKNKEKLKKYNSNYKKENKLKIAEKMKIYRNEKKLKIVDKTKQYRQENKEKLKKYRQENKEKINAHTAIRRAKKINATPKWLTKDHFNQIQDFYTLAKELQWLCDEPLHVDHIVPLQGKTVSGLHVPWNLQIIPKSQNIKKNNKL